MHFTFPPEQIFAELDKAISYFDDFNLQKALNQVDDEDIINVLEHLSLPERIFINVSEKRSEILLAGIGRGSDNDLEIYESGDRFYRIIRKLTDEGEIKTKG